MSTVLIIAGVTVATLVLGVILLARNHMRWVARQTPAGVWQGLDGQLKITLQFDGGPHEGIYKQLIESDGKQIREFGYWSAQVRELRMIIMASDDVRNHPRFGQDTAYTILYIGPTRIKIDGPDRSEITYERAPEGTKLDFDKNVEPAAPPNGGSAAPRENSAATGGPPSVS